MDYLLSAKEVAAKWGVSQRRVVVLCSEGRVPGAQIVGNSWVIPGHVSKPADARMKIEKKDGPRPFLKWAGGKSRITKEIVKEFPKFNNYFEPFLGSGAIYFEMTPQKGILNDSNSSLIDVYKHIRCRPEELMLEMDIIQDQYNQLEVDDDKKDMYYAFRDEYNNTVSSIRKSALFIFLNKLTHNIYSVFTRIQFS